MEPQPIVTDWRMTQVPTQDGGSTFIRTVPQDGQVIKQFQSMDAARQYVQEDATFEGEPTSQVGGLDKYPSERVEAMEHYRLVKAAESTQQFTVTQENYPYVKTFEKVPGATVEGSGAPENTTVQASVEMRVPSTNSTFTYTQQTRTDENGEFTMTVPYSTTGYDEFGPENGYTNVSVRATGQYSFSTQPQVGTNNTIVSYESQADVSEAQVVGAEEGPVDVTLERNERNFSLQQGGSNSSDTSANGLAGEHVQSGSSTATTDSPDGALTTADTAEARTADA
jgi:dolichyl-diphosphooligosaccharide--protein glycosyltransferase